MRTAKHVLLQQALIMRDQKYRIPSHRRRHEVNINEHCLDDFYCEKDEQKNGFFFGVMFTLCAAIFALAVLAV